MKKIWKKMEDDPVGKLMAFLWIIPTGMCALMDTIYYDKIGHHSSLILTLFVLNAITVIIFYSGILDCFIPPILKDEPESENKEQTVRCPQCKYAICRNPEKNQTTNKNE
jgi:hypothetical protein